MESNHFPTHQLSGSGRSGPGHCQYRLRLRARTRSVDWKEIAEVSGQNLDVQVEEGPPSVKASGREGLNSLKRVNYIIVVFRLHCVAVLLFATKARSQIAGTGNYSGNRHRRNRGRRPERIRDTHQSVNACDALWCYGTTIAETS